MSGGKGGGSTTSVEVPEYIEQAAQRNLNRADRLSKMGYVPEYGPTVAAFTPMQEAAFQNTADTAGAFGMAAPTSQRDIMGGMDAPTEYAGGLRGYSSAPIYQGMVDEFAADRPAQKSYMDSFFIDPYSGEYGSNVQPFMDYTQSGTMADAANAQRANDLAIAQAQAGAGPQYVSNMNLTQNELDNYATTISPDMSYNPTTDVLNQDQRSYVDSSTDARLAQEDINSSILGNANNNFMDDLKGSIGIDPTFENPSSAGSYGGSLVTGEPTSTGGFTSIKDMFDGGGAGTSGDTFEGGVSAISNVVAKPVGSSNDDDDSGGGGGGGCVVATHAVESGAFTPSMKREAVVWCMNVLHGKWWGEAIRRGYRHLGNKKIAQGKAREHYSEFRRYIAFASGKDRTLRGAVTFTIRTAQFFAVGLVKKDA